MIQAKENLGKMTKYYCESCKHDFYLGSEKEKKCIYCGYSGSIENKPLQNVNFLKDYYGKKQEKIINNLHRAGLRKCNKCQIFVGVDYIGENGICCDCNL